ncbi:hypothetical protein CRG98_044411 [Punica granatum]|uniref:Uncharacterized protein n=1 Tax=Punica granatum TaxID=22663 RepID=A0A2I0HU49_PUNGR|nr:hypothetical protein CRG98_044411 [Punica granatum]
MSLESGFVREKAFSFNPPQEKLNTLWAPPTTIWSSTVSTKRAIPRSRLIAYKPMTPNNLLTVKASKKEYHYHLYPRTAAAHSPSGTVMCGSNKLRSEANPRLQTMSQNLQSACVELQLMGQRQPALATAHSPRPNEPAKIVFESPLVTASPCPISLGSKMN